MSQHGRTLEEEVLNALTHLPIGCFALFSFETTKKTSIFLFFSMLTFFFSFLYHATTNQRLKSFFRRLDIASIFWLVSASVFAFIPVYVAIPVLAFCFLLSFPVLKAGTSTVFTDVAIIILTIACLMLTFVFSDAWPLFTLGVFFYACGLPFYFKDETKWAHLVWHLFVIAGWYTHLWAHQ